MTEKKHEFTDETVTSYRGETLHRIRALRNFGAVKAGDLGGFIKSEHNLSQEGDAWVGDGAQVGGNARVSGDAQVSGNSLVGGNAQVGGDTLVVGNVWIIGDARVSGGMFLGDVKKEAPEPSRHSKSQLAPKAIKGFTP